jgi:four helix bundle protein
MGMRVDTGAAGQARARLRLALAPARSGDGDGATAKLVVRVMPPPSLEGGITMTEIETTRSLLPHHRLRAFGVAVELLELVRAARITDRVLCNQALKAAKSACANVAEGAGRVLTGDKARSYGIARAEALEAVALTEIAMHSGEARRELLGALLGKGNQVYALLSALIRRARTEVARTGRLARRAVTRNSSAGSSSSRNSASRA